MPSDGRATPQLRYVPALDGLRAIAVLAVFVYHLHPRLLPGGFVGVDVFFVLSGYLITRIIDGDLHAGRFSLGHFYQRRIARIFPALFVMGASTLVMAEVLYTGIDRSTTGAGLAATAASVMNLKLLFQGDYFQLSADAQPLLHCWSLSLEEQFYLVYPLLLAGLHRHARAATFSVVAALTLASAVACGILTASHPSSAFYLPVTRAWELLSGGLIAMWFGGKLVSSGPLAEATAGLGLTLVAIALFVTPGGSAFPGAWPALPVAGVLLMVWSLAAATPNERIPRVLRLLASPAMVAIGRGSYSLYLWHWPTFSFVDYAGYLWPESVRLAAKVVASIVLAVLSYHVIENPLRRILGKSANWRTAYGVYLVGSMLLLAAGVAARSHDNVSAGIRGVRSGGVRYNARARGPSVLLLGDSHAGMYGPLLRDICRRRESPLTVVNVSGMNPLPSNEGAGSELWNQARVILAREKPKCVVLAANWSNWLAAEGGPALLDVAIAEILEHADRLVVVTQAPFLPGEASRESMRHGARPPFFERHDDSLVRRRVNDAVKSRARGNVVVVDAGRYFVGGDGEIRFWDDKSRQLFHDRIHISDVGARLVAEELQSAMWATE